MKVRFLDEWGSKIEISGEINSSFTIGQNKTVTFAKNATFQGKELNDYRQMPVGSSSV